MQITVDEQGNVEPRGAAIMLTEINQAFSLPEGGEPVPKTPASVRAFQCEACKETFEALAGKVTVHNCSPE